MTQKKDLNLFDFKVSHSIEDQEALRQLKKIATDLTGVQLNERHHSMITSRLGKRMLELNLKSISEYIDYFNAHREDESPKLVSLMTTHHTYFFREFSHFEFIQNHILPQLLPIIKNRADKKIRIWSAACSRGQEVYSLAMFFESYIKTLDFKLDYEITGTDIDSESVSIAKNGVYHRDELKEVPMKFLGDHWVRGKGDIEAFVKARKSLRDHCKFESKNLLEKDSDLSDKGTFDIILCKNVFIYFNSDQIKEITEKLLKKLDPNGFLFIGISESLSGMQLPVKSLGPSVYCHQKRAEELQKESKLSTSSKTDLKKPVSPEKSLEINKPVRVLCVDDSPSILTLLKQILSKDKGFEIVGTAKNGLEAAQQVAALKPDVLTLDIHMPEQTGIEYLERNFKSGHPPVIMVTSVSRENAELAGKALALGAADYVEKPALNNLIERGEEIRTKIKCALLSKDTNIPLKLDRSFQVKSQLNQTDQKLRIIVMSLSSRNKLKSLLSDFGGNQPPIVILIEGANDALSSMVGILSREVGKKIEYLAEVPAQFKSNEINLLDFSSSAPLISNQFGKNKKISIMVFGDVSTKVAEKVLQFQNSQLILEDIGGGKGAAALMDVASDVVPATSFGYLSDQFLSDDPNASKSMPQKKIGNKKVA